MKVAVFDAKPYDRQYLEAAALGSSIEFQFFDFRLRSETAGSASGCDAVCVFVNDQLDPPCLERLGKEGVRYIALRCAGFNQADLVTAKSLGLKVTRVPSYSPYSVAEHAVALLLALNRKIHRAYTRVREHNFSLHGLVGFDLHGKTAGVVGTGKIGRAAAEIFRGFGMRVLAFDPAPSTEWAGNNQVTYLDFSELLPASDVVSLHLPLTPKTTHLFDAEALGRMKKGAILINTSRGKLVETTALIESLRQGHLGGVCLDVYEEEEGIFFEDLSDQVLPDDELTLLLTFPNVLVTSHQAYLTDEALSEIGRVTVENHIRFESGKPFLEGTALC